MRTKESLYESFNVIETRYIFAASRERCLQMISEPCWYSAYCSLRCGICGKKEVVIYIEKESIEAKEEALAGRSQLLDATWLSKVVHRPIN